MKRLLFVAVLIYAIHAFAQTYGAWSFGTIAPALTNCPAGVAGMTTFCTVGTAAPYQIYVSFNAGTYQLLVPASQAAPVTSVNGKTGAVVLAIQ